MGCQSLAITNPGPGVVAVWFVTGTQQSAVLVQPAAGQREAVFVRWQQSGALTRLAGALVGVEPLTEGHGSSYMVFHLLDGSCAVGYSVPTDDQAFYLSPSIGALVIPLAVERDSFITDIETYSVDGVQHFKVSLFSLEYVAVELEIRYDRGTATLTSHSPKIPEQAVTDDVVCPTEALSRYHSKIAS
jgi:hypothetical protein